MAESSAISWTDATFNPWWGCTKVSPACDHCYAERDAHRFAPGRVLWGVGSERRTFGDAHWQQPLKWARRAFFECADCAWRGHSPGAVYACPKCAGDIAPARMRVFCASMADVFDKDAPPDERARLWRLIHETPQLDWLLLTKRIGNARRMLPETWLRTPIYGELPNWPANLRIGATFCNQPEVNRDMSKLLGLGCPNFASFEPLLGPINLAYIEREGDCEREGESWTYIDNALTGFSAHKCGGYDGKRLDWVIAGGESGPSARPAHPDWFRSLRDQCTAAGVPFHFKQWGEWWEVDSDARDEETGGHRVLEVPGVLASEWFDPKTDRLVAPDGRVISSLDHLPKDVPCRHMTRLGKRAAGRALDGIEHNGFPS
jgi:protein gp37